MPYPKEYRYSKEHEWVSLDGNRAKVGITDHAQSELGDVVFVELPAAGTQVKKGESLGTVESVKAVSDIYTPLSGKIVEVNDALEAAPETVNKDPHGEGWLVVLEASDPNEADALLDAEAYQKLIAS
jgi:glycine cleavage system H protein